MGLRSYSDASCGTIWLRLAKGSIPLGTPEPAATTLDPVPNDAIPFPMKTNLLSIGMAISLAVCAEGQGQLPPTEHSVAYHANPIIVRKVQVALRNRGYYHGLVDAYLGEETGIAIQRFQIDHSIRVIPLLDPSLLISLGIAREY
jgi:hypothetical protein